MAASCGPDWRRRAGRLRRRWEKLREGGSGDALLLKALAALRRLDEEVRGADGAACLALYSQAILDVTYFEENQLVDEEFPGDDSLQKVQELLQMLSEPESLVGDSQQECLHDGVQYLLKMLRTRSPVQLDDTVTFQDVNTAALLEKGVFSDIHVLALMYCGEMCYWARRYCGEQASPHSEEPPQALHFKDIGEKVLDTYVLVCEGPLHGQGWSTDNAKEILQYLKEGTV
ncbi:hypothetical protein GDO78_007974 [Eleutherodactylus coqui]|uniref:Uncharacterized protein n=1 Tax=Eleutherodactylus coqui TaxID=57060 RepID=A0A8J6FJ03_ELECQ|nr:hypothetical protein GDO78_007974 [Eleutherodactylus coqui]